MSSEEQEQAAAESVSWCLAELEELETLAEQADRAITDLKEIHGDLRALKRRIKQAHGQLRSAVQRGDESMAAQAVDYANRVSLDMADWLEEFDRSTQGFEVDAVEEVSGGDR